MISHYFSNQVKTLKSAIESLRCTHLYTTALMFFIFYSLQAQQMASWSSFHETGFLWNPALTARYAQWEFSGTHRQEWLGFDDAPSYTTISFQIPYYGHRGANSSAFGTYFERDKVGPFEKYTLAGSYAYKFKPRFQRRGVDDELSLGFSIKGHTTRFTTDRLTFFDEQEAYYVSLLEDALRYFVPNVSVGIFYSSRNFMQKDTRSHYYGGISFNQLVPLKSTSLELPPGTPEVLDIRFNPHIAIIGGYRYLLHRERAFWDFNSLSLIASLKSMHSMASVRFEKENKYWLGGGIVSNGELFLQVGAIFDEDTKLKKILNYGVLRVGLKADFHMGKLALYHRTGYEFYMAYTFDVDTF